MDQKVLLALRALNLGDLLVAVPALRALRRAFPDHRTVLATPAALAPIVELIGAVDELLPSTESAQLRWDIHGDRPPPDIAVNLHGTGPQSHRLLNALSPARRIGYRSPGWNGPVPDVVAARHAHERERWCAVLEHHGIPADPSDLRLPPPLNVIPGRPGAPVLVHAGARFGSKRWPAERFGELTAALHRAGRPVLLTGSAGERDLARAIAGAAGLLEVRVLAGRTDLAQLCALVAGAALVISGDTGIAHLASAFGTPSVTMFGPVDAAQWGPPAYGPHIALGDPALRRGEPFADDPDPALLAVGVGDVLQAAAAAEALAAPAPAGRSA
ncbi:glycosyltransferase family 9 protein, partial [Pseudonocardia nigra]|uniref:glycosyltransferase family 9 protein n=1 Tax=Pseudonocardia nigra TaxID=1921578 RepID=UPI001C5E9EBB